MLLATDPWSKVRGLFDESWFLACELSTSEERLIARHLRTGVGEEALVSKLTLVESEEKSAKARVRNNDLLNAELILNNRLNYDRLIPECDQFPSEEC